MDFKVVEKAREHYRRAGIAVIAASRRDADLTQEQLGERIGLTRDQVAALESGRRKLGIEDLPIIAKALKLNPKTLFDRIMSW